METPQKSKKSYSNLASSRNRRSNVLKRLEHQLKSETKNSKEGIVQLTDSDRKRIEKEINTLSSRV